jgi:pyruvate/2-oxoglutarate dehydrogenase complex dihydrolipoamide acyltransferase (E2) component
VLLAILAEEKSILPVHYVIAVLGEKGSDVPDFSEENKIVLDEFNKKSVGDVSVDKEVVNKRNRKERIRSTPVARRLAKAHNIELRVVKDYFDIDMVKESHVKKYLEEFNNG